MRTFIFAVGRVDSNRDIVMRPQYAPASEDAYAIGEMDGDDGCPCEPLTYYSDLASVEAYIIGWRAAQPVDGTLQDVIDIANADYLAEEWRDAWLEEDFNRGGC